MKKYICLIIILVSAATGFSQSAKKDSVAIYQLLEKEAATWRAGDVKAHADCWVIRPYSRILIYSADGKVIDLNPNIIISPPANMMGNGGRAIFSNFKVTIHGTEAWASHNEESVTKDGQSNFSYEVRFLEKVNGHWKLVGQTMYSYKK